MQAIRVLKATRAGSDDAASQCFAKQSHVSELKHTHLVELPPDVLLLPELSPDVLLHVVELRGAVEL